MTITITSMVSYGYQRSDERRLTSSIEVRQRLKVKAGRDAREGLVSSYSPTLPSVSVSVLGVLS